MVNLQINCTPKETLSRAMNRPIVASRALYYKNVCLAVSQMAAMYITPDGVTVTTKCANNLRLLRKQRHYGAPYIR